MPDEREEDEKREDEGLLAPLGDPDDMPDEREEDERGEDAPLIGADDDIDEEDDCEDDGEEEGWGGHNTSVTVNRIVPLYKSRTTWNGLHDSEINV
jgi:hypothetical protein